MLQYDILFWMYIKAANQGDPASPYERQSYSGCLRHGPSAAKASEGLSSPLLRLDQLVCLQ